MQRKASIIAWIPIILFTIVIAFFTLPWLLIGLGGLLEDDPPVPQVTYAEFPVRLEYEVNGQKKVATDTVICEYDGVGWNEGQGKHRKWKDQLKSGNEYILLEHINETTAIFFAPESAKYYMNDIQEYDGVSTLFPDALLYQKQGEPREFSIINADELFEKYKIKLIKLEDSPPIKNSFVEEK
ncbi:hypothetical protein J2Z32_000060 [Paenibacillus turicensis]|uniref:DUF4825 domain-containing protein n=1 Tax=Paenibacillus turicensis TaxID=160487 RepID=A0ABS4FM73_9BACL|nr:hypothetical protein [Paenibacillus turicensis]MBP1903448.1 hypothetical protein [Paenibacillus turicensis]